MNLFRTVLSIGLGLALCACAAQRQEPRANRIVGLTAIGATPSGAYLAARHAQQARDHARAADLYARALVFAPDDPELLRRTFNAMASEGRIDEAASLAERLQRQQITIQMATLVSAVHAAKNGDLFRAEAELARLPESGFNNFISPLLQAWMKSARGDIPAALKALKTMEETRGFEAFANLHAGLILDLADDKPAAAERYGKVLAGAGSFIRAVQAVASFHARNGQPDRARDIYLAFETTNPDIGLGRIAMAELSSSIKAERIVDTPHDGMAEALFDLASLLHQQNVDEVALVLVRLSLYLRPDFEIAKLLVADILENSGQGELAVAIYESLPPNSLFNWSARLRAAAILDNLGRIDEAVARLDAMAGEQPKSIDALVTMGDLLRSKERFAEAVTAYDRAVARIGRLERRHWSILYARGITLERTKQWERAESDFLKALEFNPEQPHLLNYLGYSWVERGVHLEQALKLIEKAVKLRPDDGYIIDSMGWVLYMMGSYDGAVSHLERAAELRSQDPVINDHLGDAYWMVGRQLEARFQWRRALSLKPEPDLIKTIESKLERGLPEQKSVRGNHQETTTAPTPTAGQGI